MKTIETYRDIEIMREEDHFNSVCNATIPGGYVAFAPHQVLKQIKLHGDSVREIKKEIDAAISTFIEE